MKLFGKALLLCTLAIAGAVHQIGTAEARIDSIPDSLPPPARAELDSAAALVPEMWMYADAGAFAAAESLARRMLAIRQRHLGRAHLLVAESLADIGNYLMHQEDLRGAEREFRRAMRIRFELLGLDHGIMEASYNNLNGLGVRYLQRGNYAASERVLKETIALRRQLYYPEYANQARSLNNLAVLYNQQGNGAMAEPLLRESLAIQRRLLGEEDVRIFIPMLNLGSLLWRNGDFARAERMLLDALDGCHKYYGENHPVIADFLHALAEFHAARGDSELAEETFREALTQHVNYGAPDGESAGAIRLDLARLLLRVGRIDEAEIKARRALDAYIENAGGKNPHAVALRSVIATCLHLGGRNLEAADLLREAASAFEAARRRAGTGFAGATFEESPYLRLAAAELALGNGEAAWLAAERASARVLIDLLGASGVQFRDEADEILSAELKTEIGELERRLWALQASMKDSLEGDPGSTKRSQFDETRTALFAAESKWARFHAEMTASFPTADSRTFSLARVQSGLSAKRALIGWLDVVWREGDRCSWGYVLRNEGPVRWFPLQDTGGAIPPDTLADERRSLAAFRECLGEPGGLGFPGPFSARGRRAANALWRFRLAPLSPALIGVDELIVVPGGNLLGIPIDALIDDAGAFVCDHYSISYAPSATVFAWQQEASADRPVSPRGKALLVGDPDFSQRDSTVAQGQQLARATPTKTRLELKTLPPLPWTRREIEWLRPLFQDVTVLLGEAAGEAALDSLARTEHLADFKIIHFATHAFVDEQWPEHSALALARVDETELLLAAMSGERVYDGLLTMGDVMREWRLDADLVTLSACETGLGREAGNEGYLGFAHAFLQAGARSLLVSLWAVDDEATALLMRHFYENRASVSGNEHAGRRGETMRQSAALQEAKRWLRDYRDETGSQPFAHPYYWAGFILFG